ncbi:MAG TPA: SGNH hydrolase domain-containing protein [Acidimicrobiales bacterium]|nr:SGNH hydrolase domain-containing protein [Acidimicrobiales bacterium]
MRASIRRRISIGAVLAVAVVALCGTTATAGASKPTAQKAPKVATTADVLKAVAAATAITTLPAKPDPPLKESAADHALIEIDQHGCDPAFNSSTTGKCLFGDPKGKKTIVLYGDSHAGMWFPAFDTLAKANHWKLVLLMKAVCPAVDLSFWYWPNDSAYPSCDAWHQYATARINKIDPAVVVLTSWWHGVGIVPNGVAPTDGEWELGLEQALSSITSPGTKKVVLGDIAYLNQTGPDCLAAHTTDVQSCTTPASDAVQTDHEQALQTAAQATGATYISVIPWLCTSVCTAVVGNYDIYADASEITNQYVDYLEGALAAAMQPVMPPPVTTHPQHKKS